ncbi:MAG: hypothetical protein F4X20_00140 [Dehalococcoidia bacterium]|nr:hypothetical protein [Dehalococcoidia bacterium]
MSERILLSVLGATLFALLLTGCSDEPSSTPAATPIPTVAPTVASTNTPTSISTSAPTPVPAAASTTAPTVASEPTPLPTVAAVDPAVDEYLTQLDCASSEESVDLDEEDVTYGDFSALIEEQIAQLEALVPPAELTAFHQSVLEPLQALKDVSDQQPQDAEVDFEVIFATVWEVLEEIEARRVDLFRGVSTPTIRRMVEAGCISASDVRGTDEHGDTVDDADAVTVGTPVEGVIDWEGDRDVFQFTAKEGQAYRVEATLVTLGAASLALSDANILSTRTRVSQDPQSPFIIWKARESGVYYIHVNSEGSETGIYELTISELAGDDHGDDTDSATAISVGESIEATMDYSEDIDYFRFTAKAGHLYRLDMTSGADFFQAEVYEQDPECWDGLCWVADFSSNEVATYQDGPESRNSWHAEKPSDYYIRVESSWSNPPASYTLTITDVTDDHANTPDGATVATVGVPIEGVMDWEDDLDYFRFTAEAGQTYHIEVILGTLPDWHVILMGSGGVEFEEHRDFSIWNKWEGGQFIEWDAPESGDYYIGVKGGYLGWDTGSYTLTITVQ